MFIFSEVLFNYFTIYTHVNQELNKATLVWIPGGEFDSDAKWGRGPWGKVVTYIHEIDPFYRLLACHE